MSDQSYLQVISAGDWSGHRVTSHPVSSSHLVSDRSFTLENSNWSPDSSGTRCPGSPVDAVNQASNLQSITQLSLGNSYISVLLLIKANIVLNLLDAGFRSIQDLGNKIIPLLLIVLLILQVELFLIHH